MIDTCVGRAFRRHKFALILRQSQENDADTAINTVH